MNKLLNAFFLLITASVSAQSNVIVISAPVSSTPQFTIEVASDTPKLVTFRDDRIKDGDKYPVTVDTSYSVQDVKNLIASSSYPRTFTKLVNCESQFQSVKRLDANGKYSYGILQFQSSTAATWNASSGLNADPMLPPEALKLAAWGIQHGHIGAWTCASLTGLIGEK